MRGNTKNKKEGLRWVAWIGISAFICLASLSSAKGQDCDCPTPPPDPNNPDDNGSNDPTFVFHDHRPAQPLSSAQGALNGTGTADDAATPFLLNQKEAALLTEISRKIREENSDKAMETVLGVWRAPQSAELKKAVLIQGMSRTHQTEETELMQVMLAALDDLPAQKERLARLGRGNGLEKQLAARQLLILNQNPQTRIGQ